MRHLICKASKETRCRPSFRLVGHHQRELPADTISMARDNPTEPLPEVMTKTNVDAAASIVAD
jgi:hypothetical protein